MKGTSARTAWDFPGPNTEVAMAVQTLSSTVSLSGAQRMTTMLSALLLGVFLIYGVGLANSAAVHNTAHDTRHSYGFPCH